MTTQSGNAQEWLLTHLTPLTQCPLCQSKSWKIKFSLDQLKAYQCISCDLIFLNPCLFPDAQKMIYSDPHLLSTLNHFLADYHSEETWNTPATLTIYRRVVKQLQQQRPEKGRLLDIGCGKGAFLQEAKKQGWTCTGLEPNFEASEFLNSHQIQTIPYDFFDKRLDAEKFDVISLWDLIEHTPDPNAWIARCKKLLNPGGLIVMATPNHDSLLDFFSESLFKVSFGKIIFPLKKLYCPEHTLYLTDKTLADMLSRNSLTVLSKLQVCTDLSRYTMSFPFRMAATFMLFVSRLLKWENRVIMIAKSEGMDGSKK